MNRTAVISLAAKAGGLHLPSIPIPVIGIIIVVLFGAGGLLTAAGRYKWQGRGVSLAGLLILLQSTAGKFIRNLISHGWDYAVAKLGTDRGWDWGSLDLPVSILIILGLMVLGIWLIASNEKLWGWIAMVASFVIFTQTAFGQLLWRGVKAALNAWFG